MGEGVALGRGGGDVPASCLEGRGGEAGGDRGKHVCFVVMEMLRIVWVFLDFS